MKYQTFREWSRAWTDARKQLWDNKLILDLWSANIPGDWRRKDWQGCWGYRKISKKGAEQKGEKGTERELLGERGTLRLLRLKRNEHEYAIISAYHNFPLTKIKSGQVVSDVLGIVLADGLRPLLVEVKVNANDPWYALVECLKQVRLARADDSRICKHLNKVVTKVEEGVWGLVVAPA